MEYIDLCVLKVHFIIHLEQCGIFTDKPQYKCSIWVWGGDMEIAWMLM